MTLRIMPLGDSITTGSYRRYLSSILDAHGIEHEFVGSLVDANGLRHEGHGGWNIYQLTNWPENRAEWLGNMNTMIGAGLDQWIDASKPDVVALMVGTNDVLFHDAIGSLTRMDVLLDRLERAPVSNVAVMSIPPFRGEDVSIFNAGLRDLVHARGGKFQFVETFDDDELVGGDGIHPNDAGQRAIAIAMGRAIVGLDQGGGELGMLAVVALAGFGVWFLSRRSKARRTKGAR